MQPQPGIVNRAHPSQGPPHGRLTGLLDIPIVTCEAVPVTAGNVTRIYQPHSAIAVCWLYPCPESNKLRNAWRARWRDSNAPGMPNPNASPK